MFCHFVFHLACLKVNYTFSATLFNLSWLIAVIWEWNQCWIPNSFKPTRNTRRSCIDRVILHFADFWLLPLVILRDRKRTLVTFSHASLYHHSLQPSLSGYCINALDVLLWQKAHVGQFFRLGYNKNQHDFGGVLRWLICWRDWCALGVSMVIPIQPLSAVQPNLLRWALKPQSRVGTFHTTTIRVSNINSPMWSHSASEERTHCPFPATPPVKNLNVAWIRCFPIRTMGKVSSNSECLTAAKLKLIDQMANFNVGTNFRPIQRTVLGLVKSHTVDFHSEVDPYIRSIFLAAYWASDLWFRKDVDRWIFWWAYPWRAAFFLGRW
jgi:hypothetical protein